MKIRRVLESRITFYVVMGVAIGATLLGSILNIVQAPERAREGTVSSFNDGFRDSKYDDCLQGFQNACEWLKETK